MDNNDRGGRGGAIKSICPLIYVQDCLKIQKKKTKKGGRIDDHSIFSKSMYTSSTFRLTFVTLKKKEEKTSDLSPNVVSVYM